MPEDNVDYLRYLAYLIQSSIYIIDQHKHKQFANVKVVLVDKDLVNKNTSGSGINKGLYKKGLGGIILVVLRVIGRYRKVL